jgi:hypothetical protein
MKKIGDFLKTAAAVVGVIWTGVQIYEWIFAPSGKLKADVSFGVYRNPPAFEESIGSLHRLLKLDDSTLQKIYNINLFKGTTADNVARFLRIYTDVISHTVDEFERGEISNSEGYWNLDILNSGEKEVKNIQIKIPWYSCAVATFEDGTKKIFRKDGVLQIGDLQPSQKVNVFAWTKILPSRSYFDDVKIHHSDGLATIHFFVPVTGIWAFLKEYWPLLFGLCGVVLWFSLSIAEEIEKQRRKVSNKPASNEASNSPTSGESTSEKKEKNAA